MWELVFGLCGLLGGMASAMMIVDRWFPDVGPVVILMTGVALFIYPHFHFGAHIGARMDRSRDLRHRYERIAKKTIRSIRRIYQATIVIWIWFLSVLTIWSGGRAYRVHARVKVETEWWGIGPFTFLTHTVQPPGEYVFHPFGFCLALVVTVVLTYMAGAALRRIRRNVTVHGVVS